MGESPDSGLPLQPLEFNGLRLLVCPQTGGIWFDVGEIEKIRRSSPDSVSRLDAQVKQGEQQPTIAPGNRRCPNDGSTLAQFYYAEDHTVRLDACPKCGGVWADHVSLDHLAAHVAREIPTQIPSARIPMNLPEDTRLALAEMQIQQDQLVTRYGAMTQLFNALDTYVSTPLWWPHRYW